MLQNTQYSIFLARNVTKSQALFLFVSCSRLYLFFCSRNKSCVLTLFFIDIHMCVNMRCLYILMTSRILAITKIVDPFKLVLRL